MAEFNNAKIHDVTTLSKEERKQEFNDLIGTINILQAEDYDCSKLNVWSYRKKCDVREGVSLAFGNMCNGFPLKIAGVPFVNSENAYIAGAYAHNDPDSIRIQRLISNERNGQKCKRVFRGLPEFTQYIRDDFNTYNIQWMIFILWNKIQQNEKFAEILKQIPADAHIVENTSLHHGETATFWGAQNKTLMIARKAVEDAIVENLNFKYKYQLANAQMLSANSINSIGSFIGVNAMGKIIKAYSLSLIYDQGLPIDYGWLASKKLSMLGKIIDFPTVNSELENTTFFSNARLF